MSLSKRKIKKIYPKYSTILSKYCREWERWCNENCDGQKMRSSSGPYVNRSCRCSYQSPTYGWCWAHVSYACPNQGQVDYEYFHMCCNSKATSLHVSLLVFTNLQETDAMHEQCVKYFWSIECIVRGHRLIALLMFLALFHRSFALLFSPGIQLPLSLLAGAVRCQIPSAN